MTLGWQRPPAKKVTGEVVTSLFEPLYRSLGENSAIDKNQQSLASTGGHPVFS